MAKLPTTISDVNAGSLPIPRSQQTVQSYDSQAMPNAMIRAGQNLEQDATKIQDRVDQNAVMDATQRSNAARQKTIDLLYGNDDAPGLYSARGGEALGTSNKFRDAYKQIRADAMNGVTNPVAQRALNNDLNSLETSHLDNVQNFEMTQRRDYTTNLTDDKQAIDTTRAGLEYNNQKTVDNLAAEAEKTGITNAKLKGAIPGDLIWKQEITKAKGGIYSAQLDALSRSKDPNDLLAFNDKYEQYRQSGALPLADVEKFDRTREAVLPVATAMKQRIADGNAQINYDVPESKLIPAMISKESSGDQSAVSPKGATGLMQITPDTALALAGGDKEKADKILNNPAYNVQHGTEYYRQLKDQFGDQRMALMAYNAGPTIVKDWMNGTNDSEKNPGKLKIGDPSKGQVSVDQFIAQVPWAETRQYPGKVMKAAGYGGQPGPTDISGAEDRAAKMLPDAGKAYIEMVKRDNAAYAASKDQERSSAMDAAISYMANNGQGYKLMPPNLQAQIDHAGITQQVMNYDPTKPSDKNTLMYLMSLDPKKLAAVDLDTPDTRLTLSPLDYDAWKKKQEQMSSAAGQVTETYMQQVLRNGFARRGVTVRSHFDPNTGEAVTEGGEDYIRAHDLMNTSIDAYAAQNGGRLPDGAAIQKMGDDVFTKIIVPGKYWGHNEINKFDIKVDDDGSGRGTIIKDINGGKDYQQIVDALTSKGISPTDHNIISAYVKNLGMKK